MIILTSRKIADRAGALLAPFLDANFQDAASISFASHSLGARVVLATIENAAAGRCGSLTLMAGAIDDDCLNKEFAAAAAKVGTISVLASKKDTVLSHLFPLGNFFCRHSRRGASLVACAPSVTAAR